MNSKAETALILDAAERRMHWYQTRHRAQCGKCEFFDGGGRRPDGEPVSLHGDCHNPASGRFQTMAHDWCKSFFPDTTRWEA